MRRTLCTRSPGRGSILVLAMSSVWSPPSSMLWRPGRTLGRKQCWASMIARSLAPTLHCSLQFTASTSSFSAYLSLYVLRLFGSGYFFILNSLVCVAPQVEWPARRLAQYWHGCNQCHTGRQGAVSFSCLLCLDRCARFLTGFLFHSSRAFERREKSLPLPWASSRREHCRRANRAGFEASAHED